MKTLVFACAFGLIVPLSVTAATLPAKRAVQVQQNDMLDDVLSQLNLTNDQNTKIGAIKAKYLSERQQFERTHQQELDPVAKDRAKRMQNMRLLQSKRKDVVKEITSVLDEDQKTKFRAITDNVVADIAKFMKEHADEMNAARTAKDGQKMKAVMTPILEKMKGVVSLLTDDQKSKLMKGMVQQQSTSFGTAKRCGSCSKSVSSASSPGDTCPHCGVRWTMIMPGF